MIVGRVMPGVGCQTVDDTDEKSRDGGADVGAGLE